MNIEYPVAALERTSTSWAQRFGVRVLAECERFDNALVGKRFMVFAILAVFGAVASPLIDGGSAGALTAFGVWSASSTSALLLFTWCLIFAFAGNLRDEAGIWRGRLIWERIDALWIDLRQRVREFNCSNRAQQYGVLMWISATLGLGCFVANNVVNLGIAAGKNMRILDEGLEMPMALTAAGVALCVVAMIFWYLGKKSQQATRKLTDIEVTEAAAALTGLPAIININSHAAEWSGTSALHQVLRALGTWRTRVWQSERQYQDAILRHLERSLNLHIERERVLKPHRARADIVVGDAVLLELKKGISKKGERDRMIGQVRDYARTWPEKPVVLVLFETLESEVLRGPVTAELVAMHQVQPVVTIRMPVPQGWA